MQLPHPDAHILPELRITMGRKVRLRADQHNSKLESIFKRSNNNVDRSGYGIGDLFGDVDSIALATSVIVVGEYVVGG